MKIAYLIKYFHPIYGGAENYMLNLAVLASKEGNEVHVFTGDRKGDQRAEQKEENYHGVHIHRYKFLFNFTNYLSFTPALLPALLKENFDVIHVSGFGFIWHDFVLILKRFFSNKTKFINTPHGPFMALESYNFIRKIFKFIYTQIQKLFLNWLYDIVLQDNTFQWRWIVKYGIKKEKIKFVSVGIDSKVITKKVTSDQLADFLHKYGLKDKFVISSLNRLSRYKGIQHIIEILPRLVKIRPDLSLLIMGRDDGYYRSLKALAEKLKVLSYITFIIDIPEEEKYIALEASQVFVFSSEWEAFGIVLLEAMSRGNALVSTRTEGGNFLVTEGVNGYLYSFAELEELFRVLAKLLNDQNLVSKMHKENIERVKKYSWDEVYQNRYSPLLKSLMDK
ncbi:glycosyltransferase family 4 protein [Candidatus Dojkabacteria bacterium]|nr:glycosyltransferase family 4 protein [Candidatus Dojkabacteria bacterium]